jgi:hypothetical protein
MEGKFHAFLPANASSCEKNEQRKIVFVVWMMMEGSARGCGEEKFRRFAVENCVEV